LEERIQSGKQETSFGEMSSQLESSANESVDGEIKTMDVNLIPARGYRDTSNPAQPPVEVRESENVEVLIHVNK
jgi:hypothetical protein